MKSHKIVRSTLTLLIALLVLDGTIHAQSTENEPVAANIAEHLALDHQLDEIPEDIRLQFEQNPLQLPAAENSQLITAFKDAYNDSLLLHDFKSAFADSLTPELSGKLQDWLQRESTKRITDARQSFYTLDGKRNRVITMYEMEQEPPSQDRVALTQSLTDTTSVVESTVESSVIILRSMIEAVNQISTQRTFPDSQIDAIANNFRTQIQGQISRQYANQMLVLFHPVDSATIQDYIAFWGTETGQQLDQYISHSIRQAYEAASQRFMESVSTD